MMYDSFVRFAEVLADAAAEMIDAGRDHSTSVKADRSFVTDLDVAIEARMRGMIAAEYPDHGILGEEFDAERPSAQYVWVLDPIDGTAAFVAGMPVYGTLIALARNGEPIVGAMHFPATRERWVGARGRPTTLNGRPCHTRGGATLSDAIMSASNPEFFGAAQRPALAALSAVTAWRIYGGSALSYGRLASGRTDLALDAGLKIHDYAAFVPILEGAGGTITDWRGNPLTLDSGPCVLAAGDARRHAAALDLIREGA